MLKKLIKYDMRAIGKLALPILAVVAGVILLIFTLIGLVMSNTDMIVRNLFSFLGIYVLAIGVLGGNTVVSFFVLFRYYQNLFTDQGYLSFTLPVTPSQHLCSKVVTAFLWNIIILAVNAIALTLGVFVMLIISDKLGFTSLEAFLYTVSTSVRDFFNTLVSEFNLSSASFIGILFVLIVCRSLCSILEVFFAMTVGGLMRRAKVITGLGVYFAIQTALSTIGNILSTFFTWNDLSPLFYLLPFAILYLVLCVVFFAWTRSLLDKKLNLY